MNNILSALSNSAQLFRWGPMRRNSNTVYNFKKRKKRENGRTFYPGVEGVGVEGDDRDEIPADHFFEGLAAVALEVE